MFNEEAQLAQSVRKVEAFLSIKCPWPYELVIADNGSKDGTFQIAEGLVREGHAVRAVRIGEKGRGRALKSVWLASDEDILSYMDVDLSTDLAAFPKLVQALAQGEADLAAGSRLLKESQTSRGLKRKLISRCYNRLVKALFRNRFSDAQCGFKAIARSAAQRLLPLVEDGNWFFDTELLLLAERFGYRIFELPVHCTDDPDSRVKVFRTAWEDLKGLVRVRRNFALNRYPRGAWMGKPVEPVQSPGPHLRLP